MIKIKIKNLFKIFSYFVTKISIFLYDPLCTCLDPRHNIEVDFGEDVWNNHTTNSSNKHNIAPLLYPHSFISLDYNFKKMEVYFNKYPPYLFAKNRHFIKFEPILILCLKVKNFKHLKFELKSLVNCE